MCVEAANNLLVQAGHPTHSPRRVRSRLYPRLGPEILEGQARLFCPSVHNPVDPRLPSNPFGQRVLRKMVKR